MKHSAQIVTLPSQRRNNMNAWQLSDRSYICQHHVESHTQSHTFAALIRLSTTTHNLPTFSISEISSNNSEKHSLLANKHHWTFVLHSFSVSARMYSRAIGGDHISLVFTPEKNDVLAQSLPASLLSPNSFHS